MKKLLALITIIIFIIGCGNEFDSTSIGNCNILKSEEGINDLIEECNENRFSSISEIEDNLIGEWTLSGVISGWTSFEETSNCLTLSITKESILITDESTGEELYTPWEIISHKANDKIFFYLETNNDDLRWKVGMEYFSKDIIYGAGFAIDSDTYVYEK